MNPTRDRSLDVFRGATVALMILVNNPGSWGHLYGPLAHAAWHGWTMTDLVFPFFLFAVGNALALTMPPNTSIKASHFWKKWLRRTAIIFGIGIFLNAAPFFSWSSAGALEPKSIEVLRIMGVLQRIALCWAFAALIVRAGGIRAALWGGVSLLLGYWVACLVFAQGPDPYSLEGFFGTAIDRSVIGVSHLYQGEGVPFDPEGLASTLPAIAQVLFGYAAGVWALRHKYESSSIRKAIGIAILLIVTGSLFGEVMPINKKIWTSSYVVLTTGLALLTLSVLILLIERPNRSLPSLDILWRASEAFGRNALFIFALSGLIPRVLSLIRFDEGVDASGSHIFTPLLPWIHREWFAPLSDDPRLGSFAFAVVTLLAYWAVAAWMQRRHWYIKV